MKKIRDGFFKAEKALGGILLLMMLSFVFFATIGRYTKWYNMAWSDEASRYCMIWSVFLLAGLSAYRGEMFSIDLISEKLAPKRQRIFIIIRLVLMTAFCVFAIVYGYNLVLHQIHIHQTSPSLKMPMWIMYGSVPLGCFLLLGHYILLAAEQLGNINRLLGAGQEGGNA